MDSCFIIASSSLRCGLYSLGASVGRVSFRPENGEWTDVALSPETFDPDFPDPSLAGRTVGPCCGRIRQGDLPLESRRLLLVRNEGENHLHGGPHGCAFLFWKGTQLSASRVRFECMLPDGQDGYPGNRRISADYRVSGSELSVCYTAETDQETFLDLTNHVYWDLSGRFDGAALDQTLEIAADRVILNDGQHLPRAVVPAENLFDFRHPRSLREAVSGGSGDPQIRTGRGYNNGFLPDPELRAGMGYDAMLFSPRTGIRMALRSDAPALVLYTGGFLGPETRLQTAPGAASPGCAVALEAQGVPDAAHLPGFRPEPLRPGQVFHREIVWRFT